MHRVCPIEARVLAQEVKLLPYPFMSLVFFFTVFAAVSLGRSVCQQENLVQFLFNGSDAPGILAFYNIFNFFWEFKFPFFYNFFPFDDVDGDVMVDKAQYVKVQGINVAFHL